MDNSIVMNTGLSPLNESLRGRLEMWERAYECGCPPDLLQNFTVAGIVPQPKQWRASALARQCDFAGGPTEIGFGGARGGGKSFWALSQIAADDCRRQPQLKCLLLRKVGKSMRESFEDLRLRVLRGLPHQYNASEGRLQFANGSRIVLGHFQNESDLDKYIGLEYDVIGIEEATTLSASKVQSIRTCLRTSKLWWRPRIYLTTNPGGIGHNWFKARFIDPYRTGQETATRFIPATVEDNTFLNPEYAATLDCLPGWQKRAWRHGDWDIAAGQFFSNWSRERIVCKPFPLPPAWRVWLAMDYGFNHYTVVYLLAEDGDGTVYFIDEWAGRKMLVTTHIERIEAMLERHGVTRYRLWRFVAGGDVFARESNGATIADQYARGGFPLELAATDRINGAAEMLARLGDATVGIEARLKISEHCHRLIACLPDLQHDPHRPEDVLKWDTSEDGQGGDDAYDAARYGLMAVAQRRGWANDRGVLEWLASR